MKATTTTASAATPIEPDEKRCTSRDLAEALAKVELSAREAQDWRRDLQIARKALGAPADKEDRRL